jgi:DNA-binding beta-propeller fold protein YncE
VSDFLTGLRHEVIDAHARHQRRGRVWRVVGAAGAHARLAAVLVPPIAATAVLVVLALVVLRGAPAPPPGSPPRILAVVHVGGMPTGMAFGSGSLWIADFAGSVVRVDPRSHRIIARIPVDGRPDSVAVDERGVWCRMQLDRGLMTRVVRIDPSTNRADRPFPAGGGATGAVSIAVGAGALWLIHDYPSVGAVDRIDLVSHAVTDSIRPFPAGRSLVASNTGVWAMMNNGTLLQIDRRARVVRRWPGLAPSAQAGNALAADSDGVWVVSTGRGELVRVSGRRVTRRITVPATALPVLTRTDDGLWLAAGDARGAGNSVLRVDPNTGRTIARVDVGAQAPLSLAPAAGGVGVLTASGDLLLID